MLAASDSCSEAVEKYIDKRHQLHAIEHEELSKFAESTGSIFCESFLPCYSPYEDRVTDALIAMDTVPYDDGADIAY